ncbi:hypothetical protein [Nitrososphaeria virus YSH_462411]|uniref:Transmembrane protein n=1 Tax=Nitrososphaeria virus YSH_462411 TaxID=3071321 RepID=A0A976UBE5_9CAUD|nr:hypothetical protein QKV92_gp29 [Yangshan Harbor Nitrososphaeria virus]UVF62301.1 hypothetical protein [Nitrososphaeria virus YSH_462411]
MLELPEFLFWWLWICVGFGYIGIYRIFAVKEKVQTIRSQQISGLFGLIQGFILMAFLLQWVK